MKNILYNIKLLFKRFLVLIIIYFISRVLFFAFNSKQFLFDYSYLNILKDFFYGIRFDLAAISVINILYVVLFFTFTGRKKFELILKIIFVVTNSIFLILNFVDIEYFKFTSKRTTFDILGLISKGDDVKNLSSRFIVDFWYILLLYILSVSSLIFFYKKNKEPKNINYKTKIILSVFFVTLMVFLYRGVGYRPLSIIDAAEYTRSENIPLVLNSSFTFIRTSLIDDIQYNEYYNNSKNLQKYFTTKRQYNNKISNKNVVIFILESFGCEYTGYYNNNWGYTPFLDSLMHKSYRSKNSYANAKKSIEAVPSILSSLPALMVNPFITSQYSSDNIPSLAAILNKLGYQTSFFHGGNNGTMGFDKFAELAKFNSYYGRKEYPFPEKDYDGNWGIFDEPYLKYFCDKLSDQKKPFFATIFTLSSHHPYTVPEKYKDKFKGGNLEIYKAVQYSDYALQKFFEKAKKTSWFKNTLFVFTADHTSISEHPFYQTNLGKFKIPIFFYSPSDSTLKKETNNIIQQIDIMPSILDYLGYNKPFYAFGNSVFSKKDNYSVNYINGLYQIVTKKYLLQFDGQKSISLYNISSDSLLKNNIIDSRKNIADSLENYLKAEIQTYNYKVINNKLLE